MNRAVNRLPVYRKPVLKPETGSKIQKPVVVFFNVAAPFLTTAFVGSH